MSVNKVLTRILIIGLLFSLVTPPVPARAATPVRVEDVAGTGDPGFYDGTKEEAMFHLPYGLAEDRNGRLLVVDSYNNRIRVLGEEGVTTLAGSGDLTDLNGFYLGGLIDGDVSVAEFNQPRDVAVDSKGNIIISDTGNNAIRMMIGTKVYTLAGATPAGYIDDKGEKARFNLPSGLAIDSKDNIYVADTLNHVIRKITPEGVVTTFAGIAGVDGGYKDGKAAEALFNEPSDIAIDQAGIIYVLDSGNQLVRKIEKGVVSTVAGTSSDKITGTSYAKGSFRNGKANDAGFNFPMGMDVAPDGTIFLADTYNHRIRVIKTNGTVGTLAGNGIPGQTDGYADTAQLNGPMDVLYSNGVLYISDAWNNRIRSIPVNLKKLTLIKDREELKTSYSFANASKNIQVWYQGSRLKQADKKTYKEGDTIYVPLIEDMKAKGVEIKWVKKNKKLSATKKGFKYVFEIGKDNTILKDGTVYIDTGSLGNIVNLRIEWFPEYNALVMEKR